MFSYYYRAMEQNFSKISPEFNQNRKWQPPLFHFSFGSPNKNLLKFVHSFAQFVKWYCSKNVHYIALVIIQSIGIQDSKKISLSNTTRQTPDS